MTPFSEIIEKITPDESGFAAHVTADWQQGRTTYGGLSAALCVAAALRAVPGLPPLRSAQFTFIGPAGGDLRITATVLRQGKSSVFIGADLCGEQGLATRATLTFAAARASLLHYSACPMPEVPAPASCGAFFDPDRAPTFSRHFQAARAGGQPIVSGASTPEMLVWVRHRDPAARTNLAGLIALGDALPPAAFTMFAQPAPISTITWSVDVLADHYAADGWNLLQSTGQIIADGYTSQDMKLWSSDGTPILASRQTVALFI